MVNLDDVSISEISIEEGVKILSEVFKKYKLSYFTPATIIYDPEDHSFECNMVANIPKYDLDCLKGLGYNVDSERYRAIGFNEQSGMILKMLFLIIVTKIKPLQYMTTIILNKKNKTNYKVYSF